MSALSAFETDWCFVAAYQWRFFKGLVYDGTFDRLRVLNLSYNQLRECMEISQLDNLEVHTCPLLWLRHTVHAELGPILQLAR